ncbi:MAG: hypothetical protein ACLTSX_12395 [Collinsella sp.]
MDEGTQQAVIGFGLVAAAAGPVLSVSGRITKGVGSMVTAYGKAKQEIATYADALTTTNVASLKAYQGSEKLARRLRRTRREGGRWHPSAHRRRYERQQGHVRLRELRAQAVQRAKEGQQGQPELIANLQRRCLSARAPWTRLSAPWMATASRLLAAQTSAAAVSRAERGHEGRLRRATDSSCSGHHRSARHSRGHHRAR